jgi:PPOX class probable F420-dependent enzyme
MVTRLSSSGARGERQRAHPGRSVATALPDTGNFADPADVPGSRTRRARLRTRGPGIPEIGEHVKPYPQMPPFTEEELVAFLGSMPIARLATHNPDGSIHVVPVWFAYVDGDILIGTQAMTRKVRNVERDPRVTVLIDNQEPPLKGVMIYGTATLEADDLIAKRVGIFERIMPTENAQGLAEALAAGYEPAVIRVVPTSMTSWDYEKPGFLG